MDPQTTDQGNPKHTRQPTPAAQDSPLQHQGQLRTAK